MSHIDASVDRLTSFPPAFPDEEEKGQVNQVISNLFNKVRSRFAPATPTTAATGIDADDLEYPPVTDREDYNHHNGEPKSPPSGRSGTLNNYHTAKRTSVGHVAAPINLSRNLNTAGQHASSSRSVPSNPTSPTNRSFFSPNHTEPHSLLGLGLQDVDLAQQRGGPIPDITGHGRTDPSSRPISIQTRDSDTNRPPLARNISSRAPEPAPPLVSTTPVVRSRDYAMAHPSAGGGRSTPEGYPIPGINPARRIGNHDLSNSYHRKNPSVSSINRLRKPSLSGSLLSLSPSSTSLSGMNSVGDQWDYSAVPGFSIADDVRSIRTVDIPSAHPSYGVSAGGVASGLSSREHDRRQNNTNPSVTKIIRRLRGEGLSKTYWMADETCKECYDCKSVFTTWRRKHHCRICGQIFCSRCAPNIIKGTVCVSERREVADTIVTGHRFGHDGMVRVCNLCLVIMDEYDDDDDTRSVASAGTSSMPQSANPFVRDTAESPRTAQSPFAASQLFSFTRPHTELAAISEQHVQQQQRWRSDASERLSDDEPMNEDNTGSQFIGSLPATPDMRGRDYSRKPVGEQHNNVMHPLLQHMSPRASSRPPGDGAPFRRAIQEEDIDIVDDPTRAAHNPDGHPASFSPEHAKAELASAILSNGPEINAIRSPGQRGVVSLPNQPEAQSRGNERSFIAFPTLDDETSAQSRDVASLLSPVADHRKEPKTSLPPGLLRSRLSSRMSTSGLSSSLLSEVTGPNGMWRSRVDSFM